MEIGKTAKVELTGRITKCSLQKNFNGDEAVFYEVSADEGTGNMSLCMVDAKYVKEA